MEQPRARLFHLRRGTSPLVINLPHSGTLLPDTLADRFTPETRQLPDTDWHLEKLYAFTQEMDVTCFAATHSRYVVDLNRPPDNVALYDTATTGLFPMTHFDGSDVYLAGRTPDAIELRNRLDDYWMPYHRILHAEIERLREEHGYVVLLDAHSIHSCIPRLFSGVLPDFNLGTNDSKSCETDLENTVFRLMQSEPDFSSVRNGRFKGGYITRHYGSPSKNVHALQLEMSQSVYMHQGYPFSYEPDKAIRVQAFLGRLINTLLKWKPGQI